ncbi:hypothetical protein [Sandarakinorhabdus sp.]|uniref:hypothetical protein n=1 Tax=Sandarakinorhabdus sp. TaxID=1916663 RepID=UPI003565B939
MPKPKPPHIPGESFGAAAGAIKLKRTGLIFGTAHPPSAAIAPAAAAPVDSVNVRRVSNGFIITQENDYRAQRADTSVHRSWPDTVAHLSALMHPIPVRAPTPANKPPSGAKQPAPGAPANRPRTRKRA